jgi:membrane associated rhomboid family serine protease
MRQQLQLGFRKPTPVVLTTVIVLFALWVVAALSARTSFGATAIAWLVLEPGGVFGELRLWTLLTYPLIGYLSSPLWMLLNLLMIYWFGPELESRWGVGRFLLFMVLTTFVGGIFATIAGLVGLSGPPLMGAGVFALSLIVAWGLTFPTRQILLFMVLPLKGIHMVWFSVGIAVLQGISTSRDATVVAADFGGMAMAALLVLGLWKKNQLKLWWDKVLVKLRIRKPPKLYVVPKPKGPDEYNVH